MKINKYQKQYQERNFQQNISVPEQVLNWLMLFVCPIEDKVVGKRLTVGGRGAMVLKSQLSIVYKAKKNFNLVD